MPLPIDWRWCALNAMELKVEAASGFSIPTGCFIGVRVGEVLKQGRYDPACCYRFPAQERQRNAKIDLYQHLGTCCAIVDPDSKGNNEVNVSGSDPGFKELRLKVSTKPETGKPRETRKVEVKKQAKDYLGRHRIEERLCTAVKALLSAQPDDPTEFLVAHLRETCPKTSPKAGGAKKAARSTPCPAPVVPFADYYRKFALQQLPPSSWHKTYSMFPCVASRPAPKEIVDVAKQSANEVAKKPIMVESSFKDPSELEVTSAELRPDRHGKFQGGTSTDLRIQLNLQGLRPLALASTSERCEIERTVAGALEELGGELAGEYLPLPASASYMPRPRGMTEGEAADLRAAGLLFPFESPNGRGVFATANGRVAVWVNAGSYHLEGLVKQDASSPGSVTDLDLLEGAISAGLQQDGYSLKRSEVSFAGAFAKFSGSLSGFSPAPQMSEDERCEVERTISRALLEMSGNFEGEYYPLSRSSSFPSFPSGMLEADEVVLASKGLLFPFQSPDGRGVYANNARDLAVWVNEGSHVQVLVKRTDSESQDMARAKNVEGILRDALKQYGYNLS